MQAMVHLDSLTDLLGQLGRDVESLGFAIDQKGNLKLRMQILPVGTVAIGATAGTFALDEGAGEHLAERTEAANESATQFEVGVACHFVLTLIIVSERGAKQGLPKFARMP
ncbi:MAG: hypothetical protein LAQ69_19890 [Acidobacteriia bacterium]|nr:hypothetical protein [Terriglobia bacterium]